MDGIEPAPEESAANIFARLEESRVIKVEDTLALRRAIYGDGYPGQAEAEAIFRLDHAARVKVKEWKDFYVDVLTDYFVWQSDPKKYIGEEQGEFLIRNLLRDNRIAGIAELELVVNLINWAVSTPDQLKDLVLEAVRDSVLTPDERLYGWGRKAGVITPVDVEIVRRAIYSQGTHGGYTVTQHEADIIFELEDATTEAKNDKGWQDLFVKAIANFLMFPRGAPKTLSAEEYKSREKWLEERRGVGKLLAQVGRNAVTPRGWVDRFTDGWNNMDTFGTQARRAQAEKETGEIREALSRESIDAAEARWLADKINANDKVTDNERALLRFIRENSPGIDEHLDALMKRLGI